MNPRNNSWDSKKIGIAGPPIETSHGWLLLYHGIAKTDLAYRVKAVILDLKDPTKIIARSGYIPILEPDMQYETIGQVNNVVFPCGAIVKRGRLHVYYGTADTKLGVATVQLQQLLHSILENR
jgi:beta-1,2-mannobiose phosphorylase / 1,2-beta-oligomannan phosphorylase